jgi:phenylalanyl-tRNA synthetase alpha subunit
MSVTRELNLPPLVEVKHKVLQLRKASLEENSKQIAEQFNNKTLKDFMQKEGLPSSTQAISFSSYPRHPICDVLSSIQKQMTEAISKIVLFEQSPYSD